MDKEKVLTWLEICGKNNVCSSYCPYSENSFGEYGRCRESLMADAYDLLTEQEAVKPIYNDEKYGDHLPHCGNCEKVLPNPALYGKVNFCHYCGRPVKQND